MKRFLQALALAAALILPWIAPAGAQQLNVYCQTGTGTGPSSWLPASSANPCPVTSSGGGGTVTQGPAGTNAAGWWSRIGDGTNGPVAVKPASTAAAQTDPALVVRNPDIGTTSDAVCGTSTGTCTDTQLLKYANTQLASLVSGLLTPPVFSTNDPCGQATKANFAIGGAGGNIQVVAGVASKKVYICSISLIAAASAVVNLIEGTGSSCTTANEAAVVGSTTAASGMSLAANGGLTLGNGTGTVGVTATAANGICILQSGTTALAGNVTYVQQ